MNMNKGNQMGFGRPGGQKSNRSRASVVQGPSSLTSDCSESALMALRMSVGRPWSVRWPVKAVGSEIDFLKGASRALRVGKLGGWVIVAPKFEPSAIASRMNCVESEGRNSAFVESSSWAGVFTALLKY